MSQVHSCQDTTQQIQTAKHTESKNTLWNEQSQYVSMMYADALLIVDAQESALPRQ